MAGQSGTQQASSRTPTSTQADDDTSQQQQQVRALQPVAKAIRGTLTAQGTLTQADDDTSQQQQVHVLPAHTAMPASLSSYERVRASVRRWCAVATQGYRAPLHKQMTHHNRCMPTQHYPCVCERAPRMVHGEEHVEHPIYLSAVCVRVCACVCVCVCLQGPLLVATGTHSHTVDPRNADLLVGIRDGVTGSFDLVNVDTYTHTHTHTLTHTHGHAKKARARACTSMPASVHALQCLYVLTNAMHTHMCLYVYVCVYVCVCVSGVASLCQGISVR